MKKNDYLTLDGHNLNTFLTVLNELSVSRAADQLGVTQSSVSHTLDKLRTAIGDPLFVRSGRGIVATDKAKLLQAPIQDILDNLKSLSNDRFFDPKLESLDYTIAANDFQRDLIFPDLLRELNSDGIDLYLGFLPSGIPSASLLRENKCQLIISPFLPDGPDIYHTRLFEDELVCFYDAEMRKPPKTKEELQNAKFIEVKFLDQQSDMKTLNNTNTINLPKAHISVPNFNALANFLKGTDMVCVAISKMHQTSLKTLSIEPLPFKTDKLTVSLIWHKRDHADPAHKWLRQRIKAIAGKKQI